MSLVTGSWDRSPDQIVPYQYTANTYTYGHQYTANISSLTTYSMLSMHITLHVTAWILKPPPIKHLPSICTNCWPPFFLFQAKTMPPQLIDQLDSIYPSLSISSEPIAFACLPAIPAPHELSDTRTTTKSNTLHLFMMLNYDYNCDEDNIHQ